MFRMIIKPSNVIETFYSVAMWAVFFLISLSTAQAATLNLAWDASSGATGYRVYQAQTDETAVNLTTSHVTNSSPLAATSTTTTATISNLLDGKTYYFAVKAYNAASVSGFSNEVGKTFTAVALAPVASFSASPTTGVAPLAVNFTDSSTGNITSRSWVFGDGTTSTAQNPTKTYTTAGTYAVQLTVTGPGGSNAATKTLSVTAPAVAAPVASFSASPTYRHGAAAVTFDDTSTGTVSLAASWVFGDGTTSTAQSVVKTYNDRGHLHRQADGRLTRAAAARRPRPFRRPPAPPVANFTASPTSGVAPLPVTFTNTSTGTGPLTYTWTLRRRHHQHHAESSVHLYQGGYLHGQADGDGSHRHDSSTKTQTNHRVRGEREHRWAGRGLQLRGSQWQRPWLMRPARAIMALITERRRGPRSGKFGKRAVLRWRQRLGDGQRLGFPGSDHRHDAGGVGISDHHQR